MRMVLENKSKNSFDFKDDFQVKNRFFFFENNIYKRNHITHKLKI